ncbi:MAG: hypothetical protein ABW250_02570 [Pyrinomonadaceae bacterium]
MREMHNQPTPPPKPRGWLAAFTQYVKRRYEEEKVKSSGRVEEAADKLIAALGKDLHCLVYYPHLIPSKKFPHPFTVGGLVVVFNDDVQSTVELILKAHAAAPPDMSLHCLRRSELPELSLPAFTWLDMVNKHVRLPYLLRHKGVVLYGEDVRRLISLPAPDVLLNLHVEACRHFVRNHMILGWLATGNYAALVNKLDWQIRCLMATALLSHGLLDERADSIPESFARCFPESRASQVWEEFRALDAGAAGSAGPASRRTALEAAWLFENFLRCLEGQPK